MKRIIAVLVVFAFALFGSAVAAYADAPVSQPPDTVPGPGPTRQSPPYPTALVRPTPAPQPDGETSSVGGVSEDDNAPTPTPEPGVLESIGNLVGAGTQVIFDPTGSIKDLASDMLKDTFRDIDGSLESILSQVIGWTWKLITTTPDGGLYSTAARPFSAVGIILFVPMAVLRLVWQQKHTLTGERDSLLQVAFDIVGAAVMVLGIGAFVDWTATKVYTLTGVVLGKIGVHGMLLQPGQSMWQMMGSAASESIGLLLFGGILFLGGILAFLAFGMAFAAVHGLLYILVALGPIVFTIGMLPPFGWMKRLWWMGFGATVLTPFIGSAALGAFALVLSPNFGGDALLVKFVIRIIWLWAAAGMMWSLLGVITRFTFSASLQAVGKIAGSAAAAVGGLLTGGALAAGGAAALGGGAAAGAAGGAAAGGGGVAGGGSGAVAGSAASPAAKHLESAVQHTLQAGKLSAFSQIPGLGGLRAAAMYHRTLADVHHLRGMRGRVSEYVDPSLDKPQPSPHSAAESLFSQIDGGDFASYYEALNAVQKQLQGVEDPALGGPVMPLMWSQQNGEHASLAAGLAALYRQEPQLFEGLQSNPDRWFEIKAKAQGLLQEKSK